MTALTTSKEYELTLSFHCDAPNQVTLHQPIVTFIATPSIYQLNMMPSIDPLTVMPFMDPSKKSVTIHQSMDVVCFSLIHFLIVLIFL